MEDSIMASYTGLLLGILARHNLVRVSLLHITVLATRFPGSLTVCDNVCPGPFYYTSLKWGGGVYLDIQLVSTILPPLRHHTISCKLTPLVTKSLVSGRGKCVLKRGVLSQLYSNVSSIQLLTPQKYYILCDEVHEMNFSSAL